MARDNYSYKKYQRELAKKKKREDKLLRKLNKKKGLDVQSPEGVQVSEEVPGQDGGVEPQQEGPIAR
ncbi:MAG: hypothetical protein V1682_05980 [Candidatus Omnitrophota bacterium]